MASPSSPTQSNWTLYRPPSTPDGTRQRPHHSQASSPVTAFRGSAPVTKAPQNGAPKRDVASYVFPSGPWPSDIASSYSCQLVQIFNTTCLCFAVPIYALSPSTSQWQTREFVNMTYEPKSESSGTVKLLFSHIQKLGLAPALDGNTRTYVFARPYEGSVTHKSQRCEPLGMLAARSGSNGQVAVDVGVSPSLSAIMNHREMYGDTQLSTILGQLCACEMLSWLARPHLKIDAHNEALPHIATCNQKVFIGGTRSHLSVDMRGLASHGLTQGREANSYAVLETACESWHRELEGRRQQLTQPANKADLVGVGAHSGAF